MTGFDRFTEICSSDTLLTQVTGHYFDQDGPPMLRAITLEFETISIVLVAKENDDSIDVITDAAYHRGDAGPARKLDKESPWKNAISKPVMWAWKMVNQQGYWDGIQLEFARNVEDQATRIQLLVMASQIEVYDGS